MLYNILKIHTDTDMESIFIKNPLYKKRKTCLNPRI